MQLLGQDERRAGVVANTIVKDARLSREIRAGHAAAINTRLGVLAKQVGAARTRLIVWGTGRFDRARAPRSGRRAARSTATPAFDRVDRRLDAVGPVLRGGAAGFNHVHAVLTERGRVVGSTLIGRAPSPLPEAGRRRYRGAHYRGRRS